MSAFVAQQPSVGAGSDTSTRPLYEHAEDLTPAPRVNLRKHRWYDTYPLPPEVEAFIEAGRQATADLAAAVAASRAARGVTP